MATLTVYAELSDGYINSDNSTYSTARTGGSKTAYNSGTTMACGQGYWASPLYRCIELFVQYNTSAITDAAKISSVNEHLYVTGTPSSSYEEEIRAYNWGADLGTSDWISGADLGNSTLLFTGTAPATGGYFDFSGNAAFLAHINKTGNTIIIHNSEDHRVGNAPTTVEYSTYRSTNAAGTTNDPKLVIDYAVANTTNFFMFF